MTAKTPEEHRIYMRDLQRKNRAAFRAKIEAQKAGAPRQLKTEPEIPPERLPSKYYDTPFAHFFGDPPLGRRALDEKYPAGYQERNGANPVMSAQPPGGEHGLAEAEPG